MVGQFSFSPTGSNSAYNNAVQSTGVQSGPVNNTATQTGATNNSAGATVTSTFYRVKIEKVGENQFTTINPDESPNVNLSFTFSDPLIPPTPPAGTRVVIFADVHNTTAIRYVTEFETGFVINDFVLNTESSYIKFEKRDIGEQYSSVISTTSNNKFTDQDARFTLSGGDFKVNIVTSKNNVGPTSASPTLIQPTQNSYTWNINDANSLTIPFESTNSNYVRM
jgi:hypothetical protein